MPISAISIATQEGCHPDSVCSFIRSGVTYLAWVERDGPSATSKRLRWKSQVSGDYAETIGSLTHAFNRCSIVYQAATDSLLVTWDDGGGQQALSNGNIYIGRFSFLTGAVLSEPKVLFAGAEPNLFLRGTSPSELFLYFRTPKSAGVYGSLSLDAGVTWQSAVPLLMGQAQYTSGLQVLAYDDTHISVSQVGEDARFLKELSVFKRTRPLRSIVRHPTASNLFFVSEPSKLDDVVLTDNLRGKLQLSGDALSIFSLEGTRQGSSDGVGALAILNILSDSATVAASTGPTAGAAGKTLRQYALNLTPGSINVTLSGDSCAVDFGLSNSHAYVAQYSDASTTEGRLSVVALADGSNAAALTGVAGVWAVAVANFVPTPLIFVATTESSVPRLRVYEENGLSPTLLMNVRLPERANGISVAPGSDGAIARVFVSMSGKFAIYDYYGTSTAIRCLDVLQFAGGGKLFSSVTAPNGNVFVASGSSGIIAFSSKGRVLSQTFVTGQYAPTWRAGTAVSVGDLIKPTSRSSFEPNRLYFRCVTSGTTSAVEPSWSVNSNVQDGSAVWAPVGKVDGVVTDLILDAPAKRVYAVGSAGGELGTDGRLWILSATGGGLL